MLQKTRMARARARVDLDILDLEILLLSIIPSYVLPSITL